MNGDAVEILPTFAKKYDVIFIDAAKGKYPFFLEQAIRMLDENGVIIADNILYKGYTLSDYNKHKQRTAVRGLRTYLDMLKNNKNLKTELIEVGDGLTLTYKTEDRLMSSILKTKSEGGILNEKTRIISTSRFI